MIDPSNTNLWKVGTCHTYETAGGEKHVLIKMPNAALLMRENKDWEANKFLPGNSKAYQGYRYARQQEVLLPRYLLYKREVVVGHVFLFARRDKPPFLMIPKSGLDNRNFFIFDVESTGEIKQLAMLYVKDAKRGVKLAL